MSPDRILAAYSTCAGCLYFALITSADCLEWRLPENRACISTGTPVLRRSDSEP
jgi:hypothetical protein